MSELQLTTKQARLLSSIRNSYSTYSSSIASSITPKLAALSEVSKEREWRARMLRLYEEEQATTVYQACTRQIEDDYLKAVRELKERAMLELLEERRKLVNQDDDKRVLRNTLNNGSTGGGGTNSLTDIIEDEEGISDGLLQAQQTSLITPVPSRPKRNTSAGSGHHPQSYSSTLVNASLSTFLTDTEIADDMNILFPDELNRSGHPKRSSKNTATFEARVESGILIYQGTKFVKNDHVRITGTLENICGPIASISFAELVIKLDETDGQRYRVSLSQLRSGKYQLQHTEQ